MEKYRSIFQVARMAKILNVSRSGFYSYLKRPRSVRELANEQLLEKIKEVHKRSHQIYGYQRITHALKNDGAPSKNRVHRLMKKHDIRSKTVKKYRATTNSSHNLPVAENILNRNFTADKPNQKWVSDITYIATDEGWLYLAGVMDLFGRVMVGFSMVKHMKKSLVIDALRQAIGRTGAGKGLIVHSDRGVQYASKEYQAILTKNNYICSMSRKGNCYDNAPIESFWGKLKQEWLYHQRFKTRAQARDAVFEYIEVFYNRQRLHSTLGYQIPMNLLKAT